METKQNGEFSFSSAQELKNSAIKALKWSFFTEMIFKIIPPLATIILARVLIPRDFGIFAVAMVVTSFAQLLQDFGLGSALIQREVNVKKSASVIFWTNTFLGIILYFVIFFLSPLASIFFNEPVLTKILRVLALQIVFISLGAAHIALLRRNFQFKKVFFSTIGSTSATGVTSVTLALMGYGVWALIFGALAGSVCQMFLLWKLSQWSPELTFDFKLLKELFVFGRWILVDLFFVWIISQGEIIAIGRFLGLADAGIYRLAFTLVLLVFGSVFNPLYSTLYSYFSRLQNNKGDLKIVLSKFLKINTFLVLPIGIGLVLVAQPISSVFLGPKWQGIGDVMILLSFIQIVSWLVGINNIFYSATGRPDINSKIRGICIPLYLPVYFISASHGLIAFCIARLFLEFIYMGIQLFALKRLFNVSPFYLFSVIKPLIFPIALMTGIVYYLIILLQPFLGYVGLIKLFLVVGVGVISYGFTSYLADRTFFKQFLGLIKKVVAF